MRRQVQAPAGRPRPGRRRLPVAAIGFLTAVLPGLLLLLAAPASAHSRLVATSPTADEAVSTAPADIVLTFNEAVSAQYTHVAVTRGDGSSVASGATAVEGTTVRQPLAPLGDGRYTVAYRAVSADGHPIGGTFAFTVAGATAPAVPSTAGAQGTTPGGTPSSSGATTTPSAGTTAPGAAATTLGTAASGSGDGNGGWWILVTVLVVLAAAAGGTVLAVARRRHTGAR
ncbi:conserved hypothetical protein [Frankia canadensis]|uniref:CopC domain-containing protein n=1 Tax=Frankia canadensis TaxID=1836972 RepID=A0A2I2L100_9ACTN|nr:copper resistance CopC family protein [Frankia canadensis]SNQ51588.1 conserved hypothetical protein [Frankia canadensis]SOU58878.1 conserved hypothetical protein [Frankia canadensis]